MVIIDFIKKIKKKVEKIRNPNIDALIQYYFGYHPFIKIIVCLLFILIGIIFLFHTIILGNETKTTDIMISKWDKNIRFIDDSYINIEYFPEEDDKITFHLTFENLNESQNGSFQFDINGKMEKKYSSNFGVEESNIYEIDDVVYHNYMLNFNKTENPLFFETFSYNLIDDKRGDVRLNLRLWQDGRIFDDIKINILGLSDIIIENINPKPKEQDDFYVSYVYNKDDKDFQNGIFLKGYNRKIGNKLNEIEFLFGIAIAILTPSIVALCIEVYKDTSISKYERKVL